MRQTHRNRRPAGTRFAIRSRLACLACFAFLAAAPAARAGGQDPAAPPAPPAPHEAPTAVALAPAGADVPMSMQQRQKTPVVEVTLNGRGPYRFFLDTGAGGTVINKDLALELKLPVAGTMKVGDPANPEAIQADRVAVDTIDLGGARFSGVTALSWDRSALRPGEEVRGVLGMPLFRDLLLTIDYPRGMVRIERGELPEANGRDIVSYKPAEGGVFLVPISVAGAAMDVHLDTGSGGGLMLPRAQAARLPLAGEPVTVGRGRTVNSEFTIAEAPLRGAIRIGGYTFDGAMVRFNDVLPIGHIGYGLLQRFAVTIDQKNHRIRFAEPRPDPPTPGPAATAAATPGPQGAAGTSGAAPAPAPAPADYAGVYGQRTIIEEAGALYLQRQGGPRLKMIPLEADTFTLEGIPEARIRFVRDAAGKVAGIKVRNREGVWEKAPRG